MTFLNNNYAKLIFLLFICQTGFSQGNFYSEWFSADSNHLPQNSVKSIVPDKYGFLWLSTENGIVRYDGQNFKIFNSENVKGLDSNRMLLFTGSIKKDSILVYNDKGKPLLINERTVKRINKIKRPGKLVRSLDKNAYNIHPAIRFAKKQSAFALTVKDNTYLLYNDSIFIYDNNYKLTRQFKYTFKDSPRFFVGSQNLYILGEDNNYSLCDTPSDYKKFDRAFKDIKIYTNVAAQQSFIYSNKQLFYITEDNGQLTTHLIYTDFDCETNNIVSVYYDVQNDVLFLGSTNKGLLIVKRQDFKHNTTPYHHSSGTDDVYYALAKYTNNSILTSTGEIFGQNGETSIIDIGPYTDKYMLVIDDNGDVWTKKSKWLYRFSKKSNFKKFEKWEFRTPLSTLTKALDGTIFIGVFADAGKKGGLLYTIDPKVALPSPQFLFNLGFAPSEITDIDGKTLWAGSWKGLYKIYLNIKKVQRIKGIDAHVRNIYAPNANEAWIGTYSRGFYLYRNNKFVNLPADRNGYLLTSHCITEDHKGFIWITTNKGLFTAKKQDIYNYADNKTKQVYYHLYDKNSGFLNNEFNGGCKPCSVNLSNEAIFFPSMDGVVYFNPDNIKKRQPQNNIFLDQTDIDTVSYNASEKPIFKRNFGKIKFFLSSPFFGNAYNQNIETRLEGSVTQDWTPMTENNVSFSTLPPGDYVLKTRKLEGFGSKYIYRDFNFRITPAFWQTGWFKILMVFCGMLLIYLIYKLRVRYIKHKNIQLEKQVVLKTEQLQTTIIALRQTKNDLSKQVSNHKNLIKTITHDIKSPLKFIAITGRFIYKNIDKPETLSKDDIKAIYTSSSQLYHFVDNFLDYAKETDLNNNDSEPYSLYSLINEKAGFFKNIAAAGKTIIKNEVESSLFITLNRHLLAIILHNLLDNALKNTFEGIISIGAVAKDQELSIAIKDTGKGMNPETVNYYMALAEGKSALSKQKGMGLHMIIELLAIIGGTIHIQSEINKGTTITLSFTRNN